MTSPKRTVLLEQLRRAHEAGQLTAALKQSRPKQRVPTAFVQDLFPELFGTPALN